METIMAGEYTTEDKDFEHAPTLLVRDGQVRCADCGEPDDVADDATDRTCVCDFCGSTYGSDGKKTGEAV